MKSTVMLAGCLILLASCAGTGSGPTDACGPWRPILVGSGDTLTRPTAEAVLSHNVTGSRLCGWKGPAP